jgi:hypothetical protein
MNEEASINWRAHDFRRMMQVKPNIEPPIDEVISRIVGKKIYQQDPRLIKLIVKWRKDKPFDSTEPDNFLKDEHKIQELREVLNKSYD